MITIVGISGSLRRKSLNTAILNATAEGVPERQRSRHPAVIEDRRHRPERSAQAYRAALRLAPNDTYAQRSLATVLARSGKADSARQVLERSGSADATNFVAWVEIGNSDFAAKRFSDAESAYRKAIAAQPDAYIAWINLGKLLANSGRNREAEEAFERVVASKPDSSTSWSSNVSAAWSSLSILQHGRGDQLVRLPRPSARSKSTRQTPRPGVKLGCYGSQRATMPRVHRPSRR